MTKNKLKAVATGAICSLASLTSVMIGIYVPSLLLLMTMLAGIPMMYLGMRRGIRILGASWIASVLILAIIIGNLLGAFLTGLISFLPGMVLGYTLRKRKTFATIILSGSAVMLLGMGLQVVLLNAMGDGHGIADLVNQMLNSIKEEMTMIFSSMEGQLPVGGQEMQVAINQTIDTTREIIFLYLPAFMIGSSVVMSYLVFMIGAFILHRTRPVRIVYQPFWGIRAPKSMCYLVAVLFLITATSESDSLWMASIQNIQILLCAYLSVCGVSFVDYKLRKKISSGFLRAVIYGAVLFTGYLFMGILFQSMCILGILDGFLGYRIREERIGHE